MSYTLSPPSHSIIFTTGAHCEGLIQGFQEKSSADHTTPRIRKSSSAVPNLTDWPVASIDTCHNQSDLPEVSGLDLSPLPDDDFDLSAVNQSDWLSTLPFWSLSPELADTLTVVSKETPETETPSDMPFQENLANERNLSDLCPEHISTRLHDDGTGSHT